MGNGAYYVDDTGLVRRLSASGAVTDVAHFPIRTSQQVIWFAVSPDGSKLMAAIMVYTPLSPSWNPEQGCPVHEPGRIHEEIHLATVGGSTTMLSDQTNPQRVTSVVAWDQTGPIAVPDSHMAYIGYIEGTVWGGPAVHLDLRGRPVGGSIGGANCSPFFGETKGANLVCYDPKRPTIGARGSVKATCSGCTPDFVPTTLGIIDLTRPGDWRDLGVSGTFLGVLQGQ